MNSISKKLGAFSAVAPILALALTVLPGCGGYGPGAQCDDYCECTGCSDNAYDDCIDAAEDNERKIDREGCNDQYNEYLDCAAEEFECRDSKVKFDGCEDLAKSLANCLG